MSYIIKTVTYLDCVNVMPDDNDMIRKFIGDELVVDHPLHYSNPNNGGQFSVDSLPVSQRKSIVTDMVAWLIADSTLYFAQYGVIGIDNRILRRYCRKKHPQVYCFDYYSPTSEPDEWEYWNNNISYVRIDSSDFIVRRYVGDIIDNGRRGNDFFLLIPEKRLAISVYDCRGLDVVSKDDALLEECNKRWGHIRIK